MVHDWRIKAVLYNDGSSIEAIKFEEHMLSTEDYYVTSHDKWFFGKISEIPHALLAHPNPESA